MTLLKGDDSIKGRPVTPMAVTRWPTERWPEGLGISSRDGWHFGLGLGPALIFVIILAQILFLCLVGLGITILGGSLGALL